MDLKTIKALAELFERYGLNELSYCAEDSRITFKKGFPLPGGPAPVQSPGGFSGVSDGAQTEATEARFPQEDGLAEVKSPLVGVYYASSAPDAAPFVTVGSKVRQGDVLCIVEAMKLMNEIKAECDGEIAEICAQDGQIVEYGQTLFKIR